MEMHEILREILLKASGVWTFRQVKGPYTLFGQNIKFGSSDSFVRV